MAEPDGSTSPPPRLDDAAVEQRLTRVDELLAGLERVPGRTAETALEVIEILVDVYGEALARVVRAARAAPDVLDALTGDELVRHLLLLHGVHPDGIGPRVGRAVEDLAPALRAQNASARVVDVADGVARLEVSGGGCGAHASASGLREQLRDEVLAAAPELTAIEFLEAPRAPTVIPVEALLRRTPTTARHPTTTGAGAQA